MKPGTKRKILFIVAAVVCSPVLLLFIRDWYYHLRPAETFREFTGQVLPPGVKVQSYAHDMTDNFFHITSYYLLTGTPEALREVANNARYEEGGDDPYGALPDLDYLFGSPLTRNDIMTAYVRGQNVGQRRKSRYWIFSGGTTALYEDN